MIRDGTVFEDDHLPSVIVGRNRHMNEVTDALAPIEDGFRAENCFLFGPSGVGKTTVARAAVRELRQEVLDVPHAYVNCWQDYTRKAVLEQLSRDLIGSAVSRSASTGRLIEHVQHELNGPGVVILDEVDQLRETEVLYDLHEIRGLSWIGIANREVDLFADLDDRITSRISVAYRVRFDSYREGTITEILTRRAREGLGPGAVDENVLARIARLTKGDARRAIAALRVGARMASREGLSAIPMRLVDDAVASAKREVRQKTISKLNTHQRALYEALAEEDGLIQKELYARYREIHDDPVTLRYLRANHLPKLEHYNLVDVEQHSGSKRYRLVDADHPELHPERA
ncbi:Cdc6/Cdc18 family protein [Halorubrum sp. AD140]|uniref:Cdc6/Cdc18 family protein n=1 Tax=Halorubrum sp. AD140 TaxID=3050073 RepID=UPI002ACC9F0E|nr:Cdc6/Cdc18 family protein [Halorubrum sp. AD140]MDZ5812408.1 Cdc6/Cdc18 family protein [Halorubrum sp. AD140]